LAWPISSYARHRKQKYTASFFVRICNAPDCHGAFSRASCRVPHAFASGSLLHVPALGARTRNRCVMRDMRGEAGLSIALAANPRYGTRSHPSRLFVSGSEAGYRPRAARHGTDRRAAIYLSPNWPRMPMPSATRIPVMDAMDGSTLRGSAAWRRTAAPKQKV
jgi:hypothetical protein